jgi:hypothetical protein
LSLVTGDRLRPVAQGIKNDVVNSRRGARTRIPDTKFRLREFDRLDIADYGVHPKRMTKKHYRSNILVSTP